MLEHRQIEHYGQEDVQAEEYEELHGVGVGRAFVFTGVARLGKDEGLVGIAEGLREHHHDNGDFDVGAVNAHHGAGALGVVGEEIRYHYLTHVLAGYSGHAKYQQRPRVTEHPAQQRGREGVTAAGELRQKHQQHAEGGDDVGHENPSYAEGLAAATVVKPAYARRTMAVKPRAAEQEEDVKGDVDAYVGHLYSGKADGLLAVTQVGEGYVAEGVEGHRNAE